MALAFLGIFLPILPTTPFVLLSAYLFSKSSTRLHQWLLKQKTFGPIIKNWQQHGVITLRTKSYATFIMIPLFAYTLIYVQVPVIIKTIVTLIGFIILYFIWSRPSYPRG